MENSFLKRHNLRRVINACGPLTVLGGAQVKSDEVRQVVDEIISASVEMVELQRRASDVISHITGAEAGCVTACSAAGITVSTAACITRKNVARIKRIPDTTGLKNEVVIQKGHVITAGGAPADLLIKITGAKLIEVGEAADCGSFQLEEALSSNTAAAIFIAAARARRPGLLPFKQFVKIAKSKGIPVIVDAAGQMDFKYYIAEGADLVVYSGHKFLGATTSAMICGRKDLIQACYLQEFGIGRPMKVGKEGVAGLIAASEIYESKGLERIEKEYYALLERMMQRLNDLPGLVCSVISEGTEIPYRLSIFIDASKAGISAYQIGRELEDGDPMIKLKDSSARNNLLFIDPSYLNEEEESIVCNRIREVITKGYKPDNNEDTEEKTLFDLRLDRLSSWPDK